MIIKMPLLEQENNLTLYDIWEKLSEEKAEARDMITQYLVSGRIPERDRVIGELLDTIQVCLAGLDMLDVQSPESEHWSKLINRGWKVKSVVIISYGEDYDA